MINLLLFLLALTCFGIASAWLAENPGQVTMYWFDYRIDTSLAFLALLGLIAAIVLACLAMLIRKIVLAPERFAQRRRLSHYERGLSELTYSVAALASADARQAELHTRKAEKLLGRTPLTLMLSAQAARSQGDDDKTRTLLEQMLEHKETEYLAARSLSDAASQKQLFPRALNLAERAYAVGPKDSSTLGPLVSLHLKLGHWQEALAAISKSAYSKRSELNRHRGLTHLAWGMALAEDKRPEEALMHAKKALKEQPNFLPAILFAARCYAQADEKSKAVKLILREWKVSPRAELADALLEVIASEPVEKQFATVRKLGALAPEHAESDVALAKLAIKLQRWEMARTALSQALSSHESAQANALMATLEEASGDRSNVAMWRTRAAALAEDAWVCSNCGHRAEHWQLHCAQCGSFDTLENKSA